MKLLILHLSDMHFVDYGNFKNETLKAISGALRQAIIGIEHVLIIVSGDLAFSGKKRECMQAANFLHALKVTIFKKAVFAHVC